MNLKPQLSSPKDWGWYKKAEGGLEACWTMLPEASGVCRELSYMLWLQEGLQRTM